MPGSANLVKRARRPTLQVRMNPDEFDPEEDSSAQPTSRYARLVALPRLTVSSSEATSVPAVNVAATADANFASAVSEEALAGIRRLETMLEEIHDLRGLPVQRLKEEIEDIQVSKFLYGASSLTDTHSLIPMQSRQGRIETLLLTLTRGMRHETGHRRPARNQTQ